MRRILDIPRFGLWSGLLMLNNPMAHGPEGWPAIQPVHAEYAYKLPQDGDSADFATYLQDSAGNKIYKFECHGGDYPDDSEMQFSGTFQCALFPYRGDTVTPVNLLATDTHEEQSVDWKNRGRVTPLQFQGGCLQYPEYSTLRHFKLRGMDLTLSFTGVDWLPGGKGLARFDMTLDAVPDKDAKSPVAETAEGERPPSPCYPGARP